jgi:hypothetical protein
MVDKKKYDEADVLEKLRLFRSLLETDQKTVDAIGARLALIADLLKDLVQRLAKRDGK